MEPDIDTLAKQYSGRRFAELVLHHVDQQEHAACVESLIGLRDELSVDLRNPVFDLIDFFVAAPQDEQRKLFSADLGKKFPEIMDVVKGFLHKRYQIQVTQDEAFSIFNILVVNWALACHRSRETKAAMQKAAGIGLFSRLFRG